MFMVLLLFFLFTRSSLLITTMLGHLLEEFLSACIDTRICLYHFKPAREVKSRRSLDMLEIFLYLLSLIFLVCEGALQDGLYDPLYQEEKLAYLLLHQYHCIWSC